MAQGTRYKSIECSFTLKGDAFEQTFQLVGTKVPDEPREIGAYVADLMQQPLSGLSSEEVKGLRSQIADLKGANAKAVQELAETKEQLAALKKAK